jgi:hypothetical protein
MKIVQNFPFGAIIRISAVMIREKKERKGKEKGDENRKEK